MVFGLECQQKLVVRFFLTEEGRVERLSPCSLFRQLGIIYSSKYFAASVVSKSGFFVSTPRKIFPRAVDRNKIRRRIKAALNNINLKASGNYLIVYKSLEIMPYQEIEKTLVDIFSLSNWKSSQCEEYHLLGNSSLYA